MYKKSYTPKRTYKVPAVKTAKDRQQDKEIKALSSKLKGIIEDKFVRMSQGSIAISATSPYQVCLNAVPTGNDKITRSGVRGQAKHIEIRMTVVNNTNTPVTFDNNFRVLLVRERPSIGGNLSMNSLFNTGSPTHMSIFNSLNRDFPKRFFILYDKTFNTWENNLAQRFVIINQKLNFLTDYSRGNAGDYTDIDTNALWLVVVTDKTNATVTMSLRYEAQYVFQDA